MKYLLRLAAKDGDHVCSVKGPFFDHAIHVVPRARPRLVPATSSISREPRLASSGTRNATHPHLAIETPPLPYRAPRDEER